MTRKLTVSLAVAMLMFFLAQPANADTIVNVAAVTCQDCWPGQQVLPLDLEAQLVVTPVTGSFYFPFYGATLTGTYDEVTSMTGTLNGLPVTLTQAPFGDGSWLFPDAFELGVIYFTADGSFSWVFNDNSSNLMEIMDANGDGFGTNTPIVWNAVQAPEPTSFVLLAIGLIGIAVLKLLGAKGRLSSPV